MNKVYLVGAGPGDPELLTLKGKRVLSTAGAVLYDNLANPALLELAPPWAERIYVGKKRAQQAYSQEEINAMLVKLARQGLTVVRLKGGDPYLFGRGGEEVEALVEAGVRFEVVPGVTAPLGIAAYTGVPLTHREHTSSVTFVSGHSLATADWRTLSHSGTLVIFMGVHCVREMVDLIVDAGRSPSSPAMAVRWGTRPDQQTIAGTLETLPDLIAQHNLKPPATIIIGEVVRLRSKLSWFEDLPLFGERVAVTRAKAQAAELCGELRQLGATVEEVPVIELRALPDQSILDGCLQRLSSYDWLIFTSVNAVDHFLQRLDASASDLRSLRARICVVGPATRSAVEALHLKIDLMPPVYDGEAVAGAFRDVPLSGKRVLLPRASAARDAVPEVLRRSGAEVDAVNVYENVIPASAREVATRTFLGPLRPGWVLFSSSSTVNNLISLVGAPALDQVRLVSIGPATSETIRRHGLAVHAQAAESTTHGLVQALLDSK